MRRIVPAVCAAVALAAGAGCSSAPPRSDAGRAGDPGSSFSPLGPSPTSTPTPVPSDTPTRTPTPVLQLPACLVGTWSAPAAREFGNLGTQERSGGVVRAADGVLRLRFAADGSWTFTFERVHLRLAVGSADVDGPVAGTWSLTGDQLSSRVGRNDARITMSVGQVSMKAPASLTDVLGTLPPAQALVECTATGVQLQLPIKQGGGTATFDGAR